MSSRKVTVAKLIEKLSKYPPDLYVALQSRHFDASESDEGALDGPCDFRVIPVRDVRSGFNPASMVGISAEEADWNVLLIQ